MKIINFVIENWEPISALIGMVAVYVLGLPKAKEWKAKAQQFIDERNLNRLLDVVKGVVAEIYQNTVRIAKAEGTWNDQVKKDVKDLAIRKITEAAKREGIPIIKEQIPALVEWAINSLKKDSPKNALSVLVPGFPPVSSPTPSVVQPELDETE
jgi:hypothetical protein